ncbi:hypothetical protein MOE15_09275 [Bacillus atrophaeus]|uniref:hypothetical protein n=1 Tax=Bacillus atrophaeus TaxID=1452 RepID=UPI00227E56ED|nr:hypothetical protein [Bacillus atrophaeus]MCY8808701.1 hypothetical protein [Bacillus atrophaeus]
MTGKTSSCPFLYEPLYEIGAAQWIVRQTSGVTTYNAAFLAGSLCCLFFYYFTSGAGGAHPLAM